MYKLARHLPNVTLQGVAKLNWLLFAIVALGALLRVWAMGWGLPYILYPDEGTTVRLALRVLHTGDLNLHFFNWSSFTIYLSAVAYLLFFLFGRAVGRFDTPTDLLLPDVETIAVGKVFLTEEFLISRALNMLAGIAAILVVYCIARALFERRAAAWIAALFLAVEATSVRISQFIHPDTYVVLFALLASYYSIKILDDARSHNYFLAALFAGLAAGSKYNAAVVCVAILAAHLCRFGWRGIFRRGIVLASLTALVTFGLTTPYAILDWKQFLAIGPIADAAHYAGGHAGAEGDSFRWYSEYLWGALGWLVLPALFGIAYAVWRRDPKAIVLLSFPLVYFVFISQFRVHFDTTILPVIPYLLIFAALFFDHALVWYDALPKARRTSVRAGALVLFVFLALPLLRGAIDSNASLLARDGRVFAREWIDANLPPASRIAIESYAPYVERPKFTVEGFEGMIEHPPKWYEQNGFEYLVFSYGSYGRFYENRAMYTDEVGQYDAFFNRYPQIARFDQNGYEVRVYKINPLELPTNRVAARFGIYGGWAELIGYDLRSPIWSAGETQRISFHWRALAARREPLTLTARLIDRDGRAVAESSDALFGEAYAAGPWPEGIARSGLDLAAPRDAASGLYRVQLEVDAAGVGRVPVLSYSNQPISDKLFLGPFKVSGPPPPREEIARAKPVNANFARLITLIGYSINGTARAGDAVTLTLYWRGDHKMDEDYTVFVHLLDSSGAVRAQADAQPRGGNYPTSIWDVGEIVRDEYILQLPADLARSDYRVSLGLYQYPTLARLLMSDAVGRLLDDHLILDDVVQVK